MSFFSVDTEAVVTTASRTRTRVETIQSEVDALAVDVAELENTWTGEAASAMSACTEDWRLTATQVQTSLDAITDALDMAAESYSSAEGGVKGVFGGATPSAV